MSRGLTKFLTRKESKMICIYEEEGMFRLIVDGERGPLYPDRQSASKAAHAILDLMDQVYNAMYGVTNDDVRD